MFKRWRAARKLKKFRETHPKQNVDANGNIVIDECHLVCFVNDEFPSEHQMMSVVDATSKWFYSYGSSRDVMRWADRRSNPIIYKAADHYELQRIVQQMAPYSENVAVSYFAGELMSLCVGPIWHSRLGDFDSFERVLYE